MVRFLEDVRKVHGPYKRKDGRRHVVIVYEDGSKRTVSYPKFLVEFALGRELDPHKETVDHIDDDFTNNSWDNLRIVPRSKHTREDRALVAEVVIKCVWCGKLARKHPRNLNHNSVQGKAGPFCAKSCASKYGVEVQNGRIRPFAVQPPVPITKRSYKKQKEGGILVADVIDVSITEQDVLCYCSKR